MSISGFDELRKKIADISNNAQKIAEKKQNIPLTEILTSEFLSGRSKFSSVESMFNSSGFKLDNMEDFKKIPSNQWDDFIKANTSYKNWEEMLGAAVKKWTTKKLGL